MLHINRVSGLIGIKTTNSQLSISQPKPDFDMRTTHAKIEIQTQQVKVQIDQRQCFNESGLKDNATIASEAAASAKQAVMEAIDRMNGEGEMLSSNDSNALPNIALSNSTKEHVFDIDTMPKSRPKIDFVGGKVDIRVHEGKVEVVSKPNRPILEYQAGRVEIFLQRHPEISFTYTGNNIDKKL